MKKESIINQLLIVIKDLPVIWMIYKRVMSKVSTGMWRRR